MLPVPIAKAFFLLLFVEKMFKICKQFMEAVGCILGKRASKQSVLYDASFPLLFYLVSVGSVLVIFWGITFRRHGKIYILKRQRKKESVSPKSFEVYFSIINYWVIAI